MSYRNPQVILDRSADMYIKSFQESSDAFSNIFKEVQEAKQKQIALVEKQRQAKQLYKNKATLQHLKDLNETSSSITDPDFLQQFKQTAIGLLETGEPYIHDGVEYSIGAIDAQTELALNPELTSAERIAYSNIVNNAQTYQTTTLNQTGKIISGLTPLKEQKAFDIGNFDGTNGFDILGEGKEEYQNLVVAESLLNRNASSGIHKKLERVRQDDGSYKNIMNVSVQMDTNSDVWASLKEAYDLEDSDANFIWSRDVDKWANGNGLITKLPELIDTNDALRTSGFLNDQDTPTGKGFNSNSIISINPQGDDEIVTTERHFNVEMLTEDITYKSMLDSKAKGLLQMPLDEQLKYIKYNLGKSFAKEDWIGKGETSQIQFIKDSLEHNDLIRMFGNKQVETRTATEQDVARYKEEFPEYEEQNPLIAGESKIYYTKTKEERRRKQRPEDDKKPTEGEIRRADYQKTLKDLDERIDVADLTDLQSTLRIARNLGIEGLDEYGTDDELESIEVGGLEIYPYMDPAQKKKILMQAMGIKDTDANKVVSSAANQFFPYVRK
tara:strand:+ start:17213 stop:18877 length:1665 start_codon:yes stop_codon:yes gene_type:complete